MNKVPYLYQKLAEQLEREFFNKKKIKTHEIKSKIIFFRISTHDTNAIMKELKDWKLFDPKPKKSRKKSHKNS